MVQYLDDRSLSLIIRDANNDGIRALKILREHYLPGGKPRIIALYTELTSLQNKPDEDITDYIIRAENAATFMKNAGEMISNGLLIAMIIKGLPSGYKTFTTVITQRDAPMTFQDFKTALRNFEETEKNQGDSPNTVMSVSEKNTTVDQQLCPDQKNTTKTNSTDHAFHAGDMDINLKIAKDPHAGAITAKLELITQTFAEERRSDTLTPKGT